MKRFWSLLLVMVFLIIIDQLSKGAIQSNFQVGESIKVIDGLFSLTYVQNTGAAFGMGAGSSEWFRILMFLALPVIVCFFLFYMIIKEIKGSLWLCSAYSLILAGAIGNLIDRFYLGFVVDMFHFYWKTHEYSFHVFNVADSAITVGAVMIGIDQVFLSRSTNKKTDAANPA